MYMLNMTAGEMVGHKNLATELDEDSLKRIATDNIDEYNLDKDSRTGWETKYEAWTKLAMQVSEPKNFPWNNASNVKYPLLTTAALQFHARAYQALLKGDRPVKAKVVGADPEGEKAARAERVSRYMSYQLLESMDNWQEDMDRLLFLLPIIGMAHKKSYYSPVLKKNVSELVLPQDLVYSYYSKDYDSCSKTQIMGLTVNELIEYQRAGVYRDVDLPQPTGEQYKTKVGERDAYLGLSPTSERSEATPYTILERHTFLDLDGDGYAEPVIVTIEETSQVVLRIVARYDKKGIHKTDGKISRIDPTAYYTLYKFFPDPESNTYGLGLGTVLGPINYTVNTITNQLVDAGTLSNLQGGFLGRGARISKGGSSRFKPGEWKTLNTSTGDDLRKNIFPMPVKEPSTVLFQLLGMLISSGEKLGSVNEQMLGESPGQNTPYATTASMLEQGLQVFNGIYKRIYRSSKNEYSKLYSLNGKHLTDRVYFNVLDAEEEGITSQNDFDGEGVDIRPQSEPDMVLDSQKMFKSQGLLQKLEMGIPLNVQVVTRQVLEAEGHENIEALMEVPPPAPDPEFELKKMEIQMKQELAMAELQLKAQAQQSTAVKDSAQAELTTSKAEATTRKADLDEAKLRLDALSKQQDNMLSKVEKLTKLIEARAKIDVQSTRARENRTADSTSS